MGTASVFGLAMLAGWRVGRLRFARDDTICGMKFAGTQLGFSNIQLGEFPRFPVSVNQPFNILTDTTSRTYNCFEDVLTTHERRCAHTQGKIVLIHSDQL